MDNQYERNCSFSSTKQISTTVQSDSKDKNTIEAVKAGPSVRINGTSQAITKSIFRRPQRIFSLQLRKECVMLLRISWPISLSGLIIFVLPISTYAFVGHLGKNELGGIGIAGTLTTSTGAIVVFGFSSAALTVFSQAYGAKNFQQLSVLYVRALLLCGLLFFPIICIWINAENVFLLLRQDPTISRLAQEYLMCYFPILLLQVFYEVTHRYFSAQELIYPLIVVTFIASGVCIVINGVLVYKTNIGIRSGAAAIGSAYLVADLALVGFMYHFTKFSCRDLGNGVAILEDWKSFFALGLPGIAMYSTEVLVFESGSLVMGSVSKLELDAYIIIYQLVTMLYMIFSGISTATAVRVGGYLGAGDAQGAILSAKAGYICNVVIAVVLISIALALKDVIGYVFTSEADVVQLVSSVVPLLAIFSVVDCLQVEGSGIMNGIGLQKYGAVINSVGYILLALPTGTSLVLFANKGLFGFWIGLLSGVSCQAISFAIVLLRVDWNVHANKAKEKYQIKMPNNNYASCSTGQDSKGIGLCERDNETNKENDTGDKDFLIRDFSNTRISKWLILKRSLVIFAFVGTLVIGVVIKLVL